MNVASLFDDTPTQTGPYTGVPQHRLPSAPLASPADPVTSHDAGERHERSGRLGRNAEIVFAIVRDNPGLTSVEIFSAQDRSSLDRHEVSRRLSDLRNAGRVRQGAAKECSIKRVAMVSWFVVE